MPKRHGYKSECSGQEIKLFPSRCGLHIDVQCFTLDVLADLIPYHNPVIPVSIQMRKPMLKCHSVSLTM